MAFTSATGCTTLFGPQQSLLDAARSADAQVASRFDSAAQPLKKTTLNQRLTDALRAVETQDAAADTQLENPLHDKLYQQYKEWHGTRYRMGGLSKSGVDCSGFVYRTFHDRLGMQLPRNTWYQSREGKDVSRNQLQTGDLVFFRTGRTNHVGIYMEDGNFMHSSTRTGVRISSLMNPYWKRTYWKAKRLDIPGQFHLAQNP